MAANDDLVRQYGTFWGEGEDLFAAAPDYVRVKVGLPTFAEKMAAKEARRKAIDARERETLWHRRALRALKRCCGCCCCDSSASYDNESNDHYYCIYSSK